MADDTIYRQQAKDAVLADVIERDRPPVEVKFWNMGLERASIILGNLPSAQRTGRWIGREFGYCSCCGHEGCASDIWSGCKKDHMFCPNCGAKMQEE